MADYIQFAGRFNGNPVKGDTRHGSVHWRVVISVRTDAVNSALSARPWAPIPQPSESQQESVLATEFGDLTTFDPELAAELRSDSDWIQAVPGGVTFIAPLTFDSDPLTIEWNESEKTGVVQGSQATVRLVSPGDRTYDIMYSDKPGAIKLQIYRKLPGEDIQLFWCGTLDPEQYEEPYESYSGYVVPLTFTDLGVLDRLDFDIASGEKAELTIDEVIEAAVEAAFLPYGEDCIDIQCSTVVPNAKKNSGVWINGDLHDSLKVRTSNFYDEEGEPSTWKEVLEGVLQPLSLKVVQRQGMIHVYDLNKLHLNSGNVTSVEWSSDTQTLGVDKVYSRAVVTFSPYGSGTLDDGEAEYSSAADEVTTDIRFNVSTDNPETAFSVLHGGTLDSVITGWGEPFSFKSGLADVAEDCGVAMVINGTSTPKHQPGASEPSGGSVVADQYVFKTRRVYLPPMPAPAGEGEDATRPGLTNSSAADYFVRVQLEMMVDCRYNPLCPGYSFTQQADNSDCEKTFNYGTNQNLMQAEAHYAFIPVSIGLFSDEVTSIPTYYYTNKETAYTRAPGYVEWKSDAWVATNGTQPPADAAWFEWYDKDKLGTTDGALGGWQTNRHCLGRVSNGYMDNIRNEAGYPVSIPCIYPPSMASMPDGQYIPYPAQGGWLEVKVLAGLRVFEGNNIKKFGNYLTGAENPWHCLGYIKWLLYKAPVIEVVSRSGGYASDDISDIEVTGWVDRDAKEEITFSTICGSIPEGGPTSRGAYLTADGYPIGKLRRAAVDPNNGTSVVIEDTPERLLIGTTITHHDGRRVRLEGEAVTPKQWPMLFTDAAQGSTKFVVVQETLNAGAGTSDITLVESRPDSYADIDNAIVS